MKMECAGFLSPFGGTETGGVGRETAELSLSSTYWGSHLLLADSPLQP